MSLATEIAPHLPYLRRYARALSGTQQAGDAAVRAALEAIIAAPDDFPRDVDSRVGLYKIFHAVWTADQVGEDVTDISAFERAARNRLEHLTPLSRQALLLTAMEGFGADDTAYLINVSAGDVTKLVKQALDEIDRQTKTVAMIIEDEPIIAMDIEGIITDLGHEICGIAETRDEAVEMAMAAKPGLILADIQLADDSSGVDAVREILAHFSVPVIFITAFPERLLTGERPEPTFLITKPFQRSTVKAAVAQALFFGSAAGVPA